MSSHIGVGGSSAIAARLLAQLSEGAGDKHLPLRPCFSLEAFTCAAVRPCDSETLKNFRTSEVLLVKAFSISMVGQGVVLEGS